jgi:hypothetical protein
MRIPARWLIWIAPLAWIAGAIAWNVAVRSDEHRFAESYLRGSREMQERLGPPVEISNVVFGENKRYSQVGGGTPDIHWAMFTFKLKGTKTSARVTTASNDLGGAWKVVDAMLEMENGTTAQLVHKP